jgi:hypothetical protein
MATTISPWIKKARQRWPRSHAAKEIRGDGRYAVLTCTFFHPSAQQMMYSEVQLFDSRQQAQDFKTKLDSPDAFECHARTKGMCNGKHLLVDLKNLAEQV